MGVRGVIAPLPPSWLHDGHAYAYRDSALLLPSFPSGAGGAPSSSAGLAWFARPLSSPPLGCGGVVCVDTGLVTLQVAVVSVVLG